MADNNSDYDYTLIMDGDLTGHESLENGGTEIRRQEAEYVPAHAAKTVRQTPSERRTEPSDIKDRIDRLYFDYEKMCLGWPTILDMDDAYPHSYQWRIGDRYDLGKMEALEEALRTKTKIENTEAYSKYISNITHRRLPQMSWD